jgi:hypothetical protein
LPFAAALEAYVLLGEGKNTASSKRIRAALSFGYKHCELKNPFAQIEPQVAFHLANAVFQTACRFDELIQLTWADCQRVGEEIVVLRIRVRGASSLQELAALAIKLEGVAYRVT